MVVGLLGLQGAFQDHIPHLRRCGAEHVIVRDADALSAIDRLIIPGGESTVMLKFAVQYNLVEPLRRRMESGMPVWGVCAGAILLSHWVDGEKGAIGALPVSIRRNAYGRHIHSQTVPIGIQVLGLTAYPAIFIRAPRIESYQPAVRVHALCENDPVFVQNDRIMATTFHPELHQDSRFHQYFLEL